MNDGSTDSTLKKLQEYSENDKRIHIYSKENGGYVSAVNYGLEYVKGIYFMLLGSDDEISSNLLSDVYENIKDSEFPDMIGFSTVIKKGSAEQKDKNSEFDIMAKEYCTNIKEFSEKYPQQSAIFFTRDTSKLYKTEILKDVRYFGKKGMDADGIFSMMLAHNAKSFLCIPVIGYVWYLREESLSGRKKDYLTQKDRINNWFLFGDKVMNMELNQITNQEKHYLVSYLYGIIRMTYFMYRLEFLSDGIIYSCQQFLSKIIDFLEYKSVSKEIEFFVSYPKLWKCYILPKVFFEKVLKKIKKIKK